MDFDIAVIGSGSAGKEAALIAVKEGFRVVLIEKETLGGTCFTGATLPFGFCGPAPMLFTIDCLPAATISTSIRRK
jgi:heterodisulfide reductase subunit A-like polyferredoxin